MASQHTAGIRIIRNAPPPPQRETRGRKKGTHPGTNAVHTRYPWNELRVGDAFDVPIKPAPVVHDRYPEYNRVAAAISSRHKTRPERFVARIMDDFRVRVWRIA